MEGNRRIVLLEPQPTGERDAANAVLYGDPKRHAVWAIRDDRPSSAEGLVAAGIEGQFYQLRYTFRRESVPSLPTVAWSGVDEAGTPFAIRGVFEVNSGPRARRIVIVCERTQT